MELTTFKANKRTAKGKGPARQARMNGQIPGVVYGEGKDAVDLLLDKHDFEVMIHHQTGEEVLIDLQIEDDAALSGPVLVRDIQHHPVSEAYMHVDFMRIDVEKPVEIHVPVEIVGRSQGIVMGGTPDQHMHRILIEALPANVPEALEVDITELNIGERLYIREVTAPEGVTILTPGDRSVIAIRAPRVVTEDKTDAVDEAAEGAAEEGAEAEATEE